MNATAAVVSELRLKTTVRDCRDGDQSTGSSSLLILLGLILGWIVIHGPYVSVSSIMTPWHHDDFRALSWPPGFSISSTRVVSTNFISFLGQFSPIAYYSVFFAICFSCLTLAARIALIVFGVTFNSLWNFAFGITGAIAWFSQASSSQMFQYLGLITNGLSLLFALSAILLLLNRSQPLRLSRDLGAVLIFFLLCLASAFSKEDMVLFLLWGTIVAASRVAYNDGRTTGLIFVRLPVAIILFAYLAAFLHAYVYGSPFVTSRPGPYDLSDPIKNVIASSRFYLTESRASLLLVLYWMSCATGVVALSIYHRSLSQYFWGSVFILGSYLALLAPYLMLPRQFDFYAMNFSPLLCFGIAPASYVAVRAIFPRLKLSLASTSAIAVAAVVGLLFYHLEAWGRVATLAWLQTIRERSFVQIQETLRAADLGLNSCKEVAVFGVSDELGPYLAESASYMKKRLGVSAKWSISTEPNTRLDDWSKAREHVFSELKYVSSREAPAVPGCRLEFDSKTLRASLSGPTSLTSNVWNTLGKTHRHLRVVPPWQCGFDRSPDRAGGILMFSALAKSQSMLRGEQNSPARDERSCLKERSSVESGKLNGDTAYVIDSSIMAALVGRDRELIHYCEEVDGYYLCRIVPGHKGIDQSLIVKLLPEYVAGTKVSFAGSSGSGTIPGSGWSTVDEPSGRWSVDTKGTLIFRPGKIPARGFVLSVSGIGLVGPNLAAQDVGIEAGGIAIGHWKFAAGAVHSVSISSDAVDQKGILVVTFHIPNATTPEKLGLNTDRRKLGIFVHDITLSEKSD